MIAPNNLNQGSSVSMNTMNCESSGLNGPKSSPSRVPQTATIIRSSNTMAAKVQTNVTTAVCSGTASHKPECKSPKKQICHSININHEKLQQKYLERSDFGTSTPSDRVVEINTFRSSPSKGAYGVVADGSSKKAP